MAKNGCKIQKNNKNGKINGILNQEGEKSLLFQQIFNTPTLSLIESINVYKNIFSGKFKKTEPAQELTLEGKELVEDYLAKINKAKKENPNQYWSVDVPSYEVVKEAVENNRLVDVNGGMGIVTADGNMVGLFKYDDSAKGTAKSVQEARVLKGGIKLDNFDGYLTKTYEKNGFRVVSRLPFDEQYAAELKGYNKELHGTPDVVFMIYDPQSKLNITEKQFIDYNEAMAYRDSFVDEARALKSGKQNTEFFEGKAKEASSNIPYKPVLDVDQTTPVAKAYALYTAGGNFTGHISKMIAGFQEKQKQVAEAIVKGGFKSFLDIGTSEGGMIKTVASQNKDIVAVGVDPNLEMQKNFNSTPKVDNAEYRLEAFQGSWTENDGTEIKEFKTDKKFDVVNEDFAFQFINNNRAKQVKGVKELMTPNGIFVTSEKFHTANEAENELKKYDHQRKYFSPDQLTEDKQTIVSGMADDMVSDIEYVKVLKDNFKFVEEFWNAGNFKGYLASDSNETLQEFKKNVGDLTSEFTDTQSQTLTNKIQLYKNGNKQLSQTEEQGRTKAGRIAIEATNILRGSGSTISENKTREEQIDELRVWSTDNGYYIEDYTTLGKYQDKGMESQVYYNEDSNSVFKVNDLEFYDAPLDYLDAIAVHNQLFPEAPLVVKGFTTRQDTFNFAVIVEQPFVEAERGATQEEVKEEMDKMGYSYVEDNTYTNGRYTIEDLHEGNILINKQGSLIFIDPVIRINDVQKQQITEPSATFNGFSTYSQAVKNTPINDIIKIDINGINVGEVTNNGDINDLIRQDIILDERELTPSGDIVFKTSGNSLAKKLVNAEIAREIVKGRVNEQGNIVSRQKVELTEVSEDFAKNKKEFGEEAAITILGAKILKENTPAFGNNRIINYSVEIPSENVLMTKLKNLMQELGIKTMSLETWQENYEKRTGSQPTSNALADISNRIIAFANGEVTQDALSEEVMHFVIEALPQEQLQPLLDMIHKTEEWKEFSQQYMEIYKDEAIVRREILGKVLKNYIQNQQEQPTLQGQSITRRLVELLDKFFAQIRGLFKPKYQTQLDNFKEEIYQKLMAEELYSELSPEQFDGNKMVMYQAAPDAIYDHLTETVDSFARLDKETGRQNKFELSLIDVENRDELNQLRTVASITALIKTKIKHLTKRGKQDGFLSVEEQLVYDVAINELAPALGKLKNIVEEKVTGNTSLKQKVLKEATETITALSELTTALNEDNERIFNTLVEDVASQTGLTSEMTEVLKAEMRTMQRDTNQFFALYGSLSQAQNPILNIMSVVTSDMEREATIQFDRRQSGFINQAKAIGFTDEEIANNLQKFKDGYYFISQWDFEAIEKERAFFKAEAYNEITGEKKTQEDFLKDEITLIKKLSKKQQNTYNFKVKEKVDKSGMQLDRLTKEERVKADVLTVGFSEKTKLFLANQAKRKGEVMQRVRENGGASVEDNFMLKEIAKQRQKMSNPYDESGYLYKGLSIDLEGNVSLSKNFEALDKDYDKERAITIVELAEYNKNIVAQYKEKENLEGKQQVPQSFIDKIQEIRSSGNTEGINKAIDFLRLNTRISYNSNFWDSFEKTSGLVDKLRESSDPKANGIADVIQRERTRLKNILKEHRDYNNPSQIDFENMEGAESIVKDIMSNLEHQYEKAKSYIKDEELIQKVSSSESITNEAYKNILEDRGLEVTDRKTYEEKLDFILRHVTPNNRGKILKNIDKFVNYKKGYGELPKSFERFYNESVSVEEYNKNVGGDIKIYNDVISYAESMLLPYFKELKPINFNMNEFINKLVSAKTEDAFNRIIEESEYISVTPSYALIDAEDNNRLNPKYTQAYEAGEPTVDLTYKNKNGKEIFRNERYAEMFLDKDGNIRKDKIKEKQLLDLAVSFWADSIESAAMTRKHSKFQLPGIRRSDLARKGQLVKNFSVQNLKESIKDIITVREDDPIFGQSADTSTRGALKVPRIGFSKLETSEEVTDEILYSLMHTANQAEKRKQRIASLDKIEAVKTRLKGASYGDKSGESTTAYRMVDDFTRYNTYGQTETFQWETDFFGLSSKKYNIAPIIKHFQSWTRLVGIGFSTLVPLTSFLQGSTNFLVENIVGDRINPTASKLASKKVGQLVSRAVKEEFMSDIKTKSELNLLMQFFGLGNPVDNFKNTNSGKVMRGLALENSAYFSHFMGDVPLTAQTLMTVLYDFKVVADPKTGEKKLQSYSEWRNENRALVITENTPPATERQALSEWKENQNYLYNYLEVEKDSKGEIAGMKMSEEYTKIFAGKEKYATERLNFVKRKIQVVKQEVDNQIPDEDKANIQRHAIWSFVSMFKGFLITSINKRFKQRHNSFHTNEMEEGVYRGTSDFLGALINRGRKGSFKDFWKEQYREFDGGYKVREVDGEWGLYDTNKEGAPLLFKSKDKAYIERAHAQLQVRATQMRQTSLKRAALDFAITASLATIALLAKQIADDDEDDDYTKEFMAYMTYRLAVETTSQSTGLPGQLYSFIESPTAGLSQVNNLMNAGDLFSGEEVTRGTYRGYSEREALLYRSVPVMKEYFRLYEIDRQRQDYKRYNKHFIDNFNVAALMFDEESRK